MPHEKVKSLRQKAQRKLTAREAKKRAKARRIKKGDPKTLRETATVTKREVKGLAGDTANLAGSVLPSIPGEGSILGGSKQSLPSESTVVDDQTTVFSQPAAQYSRELGGHFDDVEAADSKQDGIVDPKDLRVALDIDGDGTIDKGETFKPLNAPTEMEEVPRSSQSSPLDGVLIGGGGGGGSKRSQPDRRADDALDDILL